MVRGRIGTGDRRKDQGGKVPCLVQESGIVGFVLSVLDAMVRGTTRQLLLIATGQNRLQLLPMGICQPRFPGQASQQRQKLYLFLRPSCGSRSEFLLPHPTH